MAEKTFAGQLMLEWFEINRELLKARDFVIEALLNNPETYWIEPSVLVNFETPFYVGELETTVDGRYRYFLHDKIGSNDINKFDWFIGLDAGAIEYRRKFTYSGDEKDVNWEPQIKIYRVSDYDSILEPMISQALQPFSQGEPDANL